MRRDEVEAVAKRRPFTPFEARLVDGRTFRFTSPEQFVLTRSAIYTADSKGRGLIIDYLMITTLHELNQAGSP